MNAYQEQPGTDEEGFVTFTDDTPPAHGFKIPAPPVTL
jgi:hypothetical protein